MGKKAKPGQRVVHTQTGQTGIIRSVARGVADVIFDNGNKGKVYTGSLHEERGGCSLLALVLFFAPFLGLLSWGTVALKLL